MSVKTRYLQLSDTTMMEYCMLTEPRAKTYSNFEIAANPGNTISFIMTKLMDGHYSVFSPASAEVEYSAAEGKFVKKRTNYQSYVNNITSPTSNSIDTINTINHLAVPQDSNDSYWYTFLDNDYEYVKISNVNKLESNDLKYKEYSKYCTNPYYDGTNDEHFLFTSIDEVAHFGGWDTIKIYFVSGYDFSDMYGALMRLSVKRNDDTTLDLCNFFYSKSNVYKYIKYLDTPVIFGNFIYDKCIEINVVSIAGLSSETTLLEPIEDNTIENEPITYTTLEQLLNINITSNIRLSYSYIESENKELHEINYDNLSLITNNNVTNKLVNCEFARSNSISGSIPTQNIQSDNLGVYIAMNPDYPYIEFYGTWKSNPLDFTTVQGFNSTIQLYDRSVIKRNPTYQIDDDYEVDHDMKQWLAFHEIDCMFIKPKEGTLNDEVEILKQEKYSLSQLFISDEDEITKFYYRPIFFDEITDSYNLNDVTIVLHYTLRFMNIEDSVQFVKNGSIAISGPDVNRFWGKGAKLPFADTLSYKVYNKIVENKQTLSGGTPNLATQTKYVKVFYDVSNIMLDTVGGAISDGNYTLIISKAPRNYKFIFKQRDINGNNKYVDLTDSYYKLYAKDRNGNDIIIEPTYSTNMNLILGELEFNINSNNIDRLYEVDQANRYISIVAYNTDNSVSSLYNMRYTF